LIEKVKEHGGLVSYRTDNEGKKSPYELNASYIDIVSDPKSGDDMRIKRMILTQAVVLAMPGVAGIYFHSLVGSSSYHEGVKHTGINRTINREKLNLDLLEKELNDEGNIRFTIFRLYKRLLSIRITEKAFDPFGEFDFLDLHPAVFSIYRKCGDCKEDILTLHNFSNNLVKLELDNILRSPLRDLISHQKINKSEITLKPYQIMWLKGKKQNGI
jgi:sucrose phosphorylase